MHGETFSDGIYFTDGFGWLPVSEGVDVSTQILIDELQADPLGYGFDEGQPTEMADAGAFGLLNAVYTDVGSAPQPAWFRDRKRITLPWTEFLNMVEIQAMNTISTVAKNTIWQTLQSFATDGGLLDVSTNQTYVSRMINDLFPDDSAGANVTAPTRAALLAERRESISRWVEMGLPPGTHLDIAAARGRI